MARKNRQKPEEKPVDFLDQFGTTTIIEEPKIEEPKIEEEQATIEESGPRGPRRDSRRGRRSPPGRPGTDPPAG